jgi:hypothetical protein
MHNLNRLYLLPDAEIADLYARPIFNKNEQLLYFAMNKLELDALKGFAPERRENMQQFPVMVCR